MADSNAKNSKHGSAQAVQRVYMNPSTFRAMSLALFNLSVRELVTCSPRRMLTHALSDPKISTCMFNISELNEVCNLEALTGTIRVNIRIDSSVNDRLREFREHAEQKLARPVSVLEAINACIYVINRD